ncbi:MAG TPA: cupin domain-containing protein [Burkholderiales bacterium]|nr:cupin domain-containing protein [Burkholderiales bacterium]
MTRPRATGIPIQETERVIVTEWRLAPGAETGWHRHAHDYVVVCLTAGRLLAETANGDVETELRFGQTYTRPAGVEHNIVNAGEHEFVFVEIELK